MQTPTDELVEAALARLGKPGAAAYFFERLNNPLWIEPLSKRGFFKRPPATERFPEQGSVSFPDWPELRYLQRMVEAAPDIVGQIVVAVPDTDNARVRQILAQIGTKLPKPWAQQLGKNIGTWLEQWMLRAHFGDAFAQFIAHLARLGETKLALSIAKKLFVVEHDEDTGETRSVPDAWHFEHYLKQCLPDLQKSDASATFNFLLDLLLRAMRRQSNSPLEDFSYIWRRNIMKANFAVKQVRDILVDVVRDLAFELAQDASFGAQDICRRLVGPRQPLLKRIALYVASQTAAPSDAVVGDLLGDINLVDRPTCQAEYGMLLESLFPKLPAPEQARIIQLLTNTDLLQAIPEETRSTMSVEKKARYSNTIERNRLLAFGKTLPDSLRSRLVALIKEVGEPPSDTDTVTSFGPPSPISGEQIQSMTLDEVLTFIDSWKAGGDFDEPNPESLGQQLHVAARTRPDEFSAQAQKWIGRDPTYVRWIIMGLSDAVANKTQIVDWKPLLQLMSWVLQQTDPPGAKDIDAWSGHDVGWMWTRQSIARLLERALTDKASGLIDAGRDSVWSVLSKLLQDPDPALGETSGNADDPHQALNTSINSTRGIAMEALIRYLWRVHPNTSVAGVLNFDSTPEVRVELEKSLVDPVPAIRSVFGQWLPSLFHFDSKWTIAHLDAIFPQQSELRAFWLAGWSTFMDFGYPYDLAFDALYPHYDFAIGLLDPQSEASNKRMGELGLGKHLSSYYWRGVGDEHSFQLLVKFFDQCTPSVAGQTAAFIGQGFISETAISTSTLERLMRLWDSLSGHHPQWHERKAREILRHFGAWFSSAHLDGAWSLNALESCLAAGTGLIDAENVLTRLTTLADQYPIEVARCTTLLLQDDQQSLLPSMWQREVTMLLTTLVKSKNLTARAEAGRTINRLIEGGSLFARDIPLA